jgi:membrane protease YdiL (CAAX protease family)
LRDCEGRTDRVTLHVPAYLCYACYDRSITVILYSTVDVEPITLSAYKRSVIRFFKYKEATRLPGEEEQRQPDGISTSGESAPAFVDHGANLGTERTGATRSAPGRNLVQRRARGVETPTTITATAIPPLQLIGHDVTIAGQLTSGGGADLVAVPVVLYNTDDPTNKGRVATTVTDAFGHYQFTLTDSVATTHAYIVCAEGRSKYSRAQSTEVLVIYATRAAVAAAARSRIVFNLAWYELLAIFLILAGEGLLFAGHSVAGVGVQALNLVVIVVAIGVLSGDRVELLEVLALVSLLRVVNLSFALIPTTTLYWLVAIYGVMFIPIILVVAHRKLSRHDLGLTGGLQLTYLIPIGTLVGVALALIEYQILANPALIPSYSLVWLVELSVVMIFVVTLVEELLFRALLQPELVERSGPIVGILITSIIFGAMQSGFANYYELLFAFGVGLVFGVAYYKTKNLPFVITMHAVNNILLFGVLPFLPMLAVPH